MDDFAHGVVRLLRPDGTTAGTGFCVSQGVIATCAHVAAQALSSKSAAAGDGPIAVVSAVTGDLSTAEVIASDSSGIQHDVTLLRVLRLPRGCAPLDLGPSGSARGHSFETLGFPLLNPSGGVRASGDILGTIVLAAREMLQIRSDEVTTGFSGAPVWDTVMQRVVGMVSVIAIPDQYGKLRQTAFITPSEVIRDLCPNLHVLDLCPYQGLASFGETAARFFFGRDDLIEEFCGVLRRNPKFLAVIGSSGSGKSSAVQAGLVPLLHSLPGFRDAVVSHFRPGTRPSQQLEDVLAVQRELTSGSITSCAPRAVVLVDQFEETFAVCSESERASFLQRLSELLSASDLFTLVITIRADFFDQLLRSTLKSHLRTAQVTVFPLTSKELEEVVARPAELVGVRLEPGLLEAILRDCERIDQPLPLLEFALTQLWQLKDGNTMTHDAYRRIGGVAGALSGWANAALLALASDDRKHAHAIFTNLVQFGRSGSPDTRRRVAQPELLSVTPDYDAVLRTMMHLATHRLLVTGADLKTGENWVEIIHDALINEWEQLKAWINDDRPFLIWRQRLQERIREWQDSGRDAGGLLRGHLLEDARQYQKSRSSNLSSGDLEYIHLSEEQHETEQARLAAFDQEAERHRIESRQLQKESAEQRQLALAHRLASEAELLRTEHPEFVERSVLLAVEALRRCHTVEADQALRRGLALLPRAICHVAHSDEIRSLAFSPSTRLLASASNDGTARIWEVATGKCAAVLHHESAVTSVQFSSDGTMLITASVDCSARVWRVSDGSLLVQVGHELQIYSARFSADARFFVTASMDRSARIWDASDGRLVAALQHNDQVCIASFVEEDSSRVITASWDGTARLWDTASGRQLLRFDHEDRVQCAQSTPDFRLITASADGTVRCWSLRSGEELKRMVHDGEVADIAVTSDGSLVASASWDRTARVWQSASGKELIRIAHCGNVHAVAFSPNADLIATASVDRITRVFEVPSGREVARLTHRDRIHAVSFSRDGSLIATGSADSTCSVWQSGRGSEPARFIHKDGVYSIKFNSDGSLVATASMDGTGKLWHAASGRQLAELPHDSGVNAIEISADTRFVATGGMDCCAKLWETTGRLAFRLDHNLQVYALAFSPDARFLASASMDGTVRIWSTATGAELGRYAHDDQVQSVRFSPCGTKVVTACLDGSAHLLAAPDAFPIRNFLHEDAVEGAIFSRNGELIATCGVDRTARVWHAENGNELWRFPHEDRVAAVRFNSSGTKLATASWDRSAKIWDLVTGKEIAMFRHEHQVCSIEFSPDGNFLATASWDRSVRIWDIGTHAEICRLLHDERVFAASFSPDGRFIASASMDCTAQLWLWRTADLIEAAEARLTRNLTEEEWSRHFQDEPYHKSFAGLP